VDKDSIRRRTRLASIEVRRKRTTIMHPLAREGMAPNHTGRKAIMHSRIANNAPRRKSIQTPDMRAVVVILPMRKSTRTNNIKKQTILRTSRRFVPAPELYDLGLLRRPAP